MNKNKKGAFGELGEIIGAVLAIGLIAAMGIFGYLFVHNMFTGQLLPELETQTLSIIQDNGNDSTVRNLITSQTTNMQNLDINLDLIFLTIWIGSTAFFIAVAYFLPPLSKFSFGSFLFIGIMLITFWLNFVEQLFSWYVTQFILNVFTSTETNLPMFTFYLNNYVYISVLTIIIVFVVNQFSQKPEPQSEDIAEEAFSDSYDDSEFQSNNDIQLSDNPELRGDLK